MGPAVDEATDLDSKDELGLQPGTRLGRYELVLPIARGGMARVWAARLQGDRGFSKLVAIKTILGELANEPVFEKMFLDEANIASAVHHPHVCEIYELGEQDHVLYLAMEWVNGDSLARIMHKKKGTALRVSPEVAVRIVRDACAGLHGAHELTDEDGRLLHVVHRDISPHNLLVTASGNTKVADFGVAKALAGYHNHVTNVGQLKGKLMYMSPEYVSGDAIDRRTDIFSMGATLYEATTGVLPFTGDNDLQMLNALVAGELIPPSRVVFGYPKDLEDIVLTAMSNDRHRRFSSAEEMRFALEDWLRHNVRSGGEGRVAETVRERIGPMLEERHQRIRKMGAILSEREAARRAAGSNPNASPLSAAIASALESEAEQAAASAAPLGPGSPALVKMFTPDSAQAVVVPSLAPPSLAGTSIFDNRIALAGGICGAALLAGLLMGALFALRTPDTGASTPAATAPTAAPASAPLPAGSLPSRGAASASTAPSNAPPPSAASLVPAAPAPTPSPEVPPRAADTPASMSPQMLPDAKPITPSMLPDVPNAKDPKPAHGRTGH